VENSGNHEIKALWRVNYKAIQEGSKIISEKNNFSKNVSFESQKKSD
jgi:hypothetical protein